MNIFVATAIDYADPEIDPNGSFRIFSIGTKVKIIKTGENGEITKIGRQKLTVEIARMKRPCQAFHPYELEIINPNYDDKGNYTGPVRNENGWTP